LADFNLFLFGFLFFSSVLVGALFLVFAFGAGSLYMLRGLGACSVISW
jgi:hypothetical protein